MRAPQQIYLYWKALVAPGAPSGGPLAQQPNGLSIECRGEEGGRGLGEGVKFIDEVLLTKSRLLQSALLSNKGCKYMRNDTLKNVVIDPGLGVGGGLGALGWSVKIQGTGPKEVRGGPQLFLIHTFMNPELSFWQAIQLACLAPVASSLASLLHSFLPSLTLREVSGTVISLFGFSSARMWSVSR